MRVNELAEELGMSPEDLFQRLPDVGISVQTTRTTLNDEEIDQIKNALVAPVNKAPSDERRVQSTVIRRRARRKKAVTEPTDEAEATAEEAPSPIEVVEEEPAVETEKIAAETEAPMPTFASEDQTIEAGVRDKIRKPVEVAPKEAPVEEAVEADAETTDAPKAKAAKPGSDEPPGDFMPKTYSLDDVIPGYSEMVEHQKKAEEERKTRDTEEPKTGDANKADKVNTDELAAFKEAFGKAKKKRKGRESNQLDANAQRQLRRGIVIENFKARGPRKRKRKSVDTPTPSTSGTMKASKRVVRMEDGQITISNLANQLSLKASQLIRHLMDMGVMASLNEVIDHETAELIADDFGFTLINTSFEINDFLATIEDEDVVVQRRPPVITIMGHVDHGKTSLLDKIRSDKTNIVDQEAGGITQHVGAYVVQASGQDLVFIDTPGHEAFTAMRARGAQVTDIVVLVVAADDGVKPQTLEAINHAKAAKVPIVVAVNKIDKPDAKPERVRQELTEHELVADEWGGDTSFIDVSAKTGEGLDNLLENLALQAEVLEIQAPVNKPAQGVVIESRLDRGRGPLATIILKEGTLSQGAIVVSGQSYGRVRLLLDDTSQAVDEVGPGYPAEIVGWNSVPEAGDHFYVVSDDKAARDITEHHEKKSRAQIASSTPRILSLEDLSEQMLAGEVQELPVVLKTDVRGTVEAIRMAMENIEHPKLSVRLLHAAVGGVTEGDVQLASISGGIVFGFNVRADGQARELAEKTGISIKLYSVIYELLDDVKDAMSGLLAPHIEEKLQGSAEIRDTFQITKVGSVAGLIISDGKITRSSIIRLFRDNVKIYEGRLSSLKRFKEDVREVKEGFECGASLENFNDIKSGDILEAYEIIETQSTFESSL